MAGLLKGGVVGAVVVGLGLVAAGRLIPVVDLQLPAPQAGAVAVPAGSEFNAERPDAPPILPETDAPPAGAPLPSVSEPPPANEVKLDTTPVDAPALVPLQETTLSPPEEAPALVVVSEGGGPDAPQAGVAASQPDTPGVDVAPVPGETADVPQASSAPETPTKPTESEATPQPVETPPAGSALTSAAPALPSPASEAPTNPVPDSDAPVLAMPDVSQGLRLPMPEVEEMSPGITTDRLPRIGAEVVEVVQPALAAMKRNAVAFENASGNPMIAIVLLDVGPVRPDTAALADFPIPLTVAIDPTLPDAAELMLGYRDAGLEVAILTPLPEGASPADVEVAFQSFFTAIPEAVAVMDTPKATLQDNRPRAAQVVEILAASGHGLVTYEKGLNTALQIASQSDVPAATVYRNIDAGGHDVAAMKRFLDQAAFRAGQEGTVILVAEARPETLTALAEWSLGSRAASVTFAPLSAALTQ